MNLIEQLGGYEKAKEIVFDPLHPQMTHVSNDGRHWVNEEFAHIPEINEQMQGMIKISDIRHSLLEHRRQHNIFEVGDSVLPISNYSDQVHFLADWYIENLDFRYTTNSGSWGIIVKSLMDGAWRHATDEEIKAGKRLEVKSEN